MKIHENPVISSPRGASKRRNSNTAPCPCRAGVDFELLTSVLVDFCTPRPASRAFRGSEAPRNPTLRPLRAERTPFSRLIFRYKASRLLGSESLSTSPRQPEAVLMPSLEKWLPRWSLGPTPSPATRIEVISQPRKRSWLGWDSLVSSARSLWFSAARALSSCAGQAQSRAPKLLGPHREHQLSREACGRELRDTRPDGISWCISDLPSSCCRSLEKPP